MSKGHSDFHYSVTVTTDDLAVVHCLRALNQYAQGEGNLRIGWGGTKLDDWKIAGNRITLRFTKPRYREECIRTAQRLLPTGSWVIVAQDDNDPASPQVSGW